VVTRRVGHLSERTLEMTGCQRPSTGGPAVANDSRPGASLGRTAIDPGRPVAAVADAGDRRPGRADAGGDVPAVRRPVPV